jgi:hypothetical protein
MTRKATGGDHHGGREDQEHEDDRAVGGQHLAEGRVRLREELEEADLAPRGEVALDEEPFHRVVEGVGVRAD